MSRSFYFCDIKITAHSDDSRTYDDDMKMDLKDSIYGVKGLMIHINFGSLRIW